MVRLRSKSRRLEPLVMGHDSGIGFQNPLANLMDQGADQC